ncbi:TetR/AcrR family transcriptional regulator [Vulgatibacter sp.]|uniref:TetR/AcrR family transcriptional regulator n=1 Tax=Vulgatibacter sp. TaxID=1971226 RepID=UPI0035699190
MATTPRRAREIARTRQDILEAAARAFASRGFTGATMQDIAREAGYTAASLYSYFSSKEEIIRGLFESIRNERFSALELPVPEGLTLRQKLDLLVRRQTEVAKRHRDAIRFFYFSSDGAMCNAAREEALTPVEMSALDFEQFFRQEARPEELGGWEPADLALAFAGMTHGFFVRWLRGPSDSSLEEGIPRLLDLFFHGLSGSGNSK